MHVDNIAPSLYGGLVLTVGIDHPRVKQIPVPTRDPRGDRASAYVPVDPAGARDPQGQRGDGGFRLADRQSRRLHFRLLHQRSGHDARVLRGRRHRAAAPGADPRVSRRCAARRCRPGRSAARSPAPGPTVFAWCLRGAAPAVLRRMVREFSHHGLQPTTGSSRSSARGRARDRLMLFASTRNPRHAGRLQRRAAAGPGRRRRPVRADRLAAASAAKLRIGASRRLPALALRAAAPFVAGDALAAELAAITARGVQFSRAAAAAR